MQFTNGYLNILFHAVYHVSLEALCENAVTVLGPPVLK